MKTRAELDSALHALREDMPVLLSLVQTECQLEAFAALADGIREQAELGDVDYVWAQLQCMLRDAGLTEEPFESR